MTMKAFVQKLCMRISGKNLEQLRMGFSLHYFLTRSRWKAYRAAVFG